MAKTIPIEKIYYDRGSRAAIILFETSGIDSGFSSVLRCGSLRFQNCLKANKEQNIYQSPATIFVMKLLFAVRTEERRNISNTL